MDEEPIGVVPDIGNVDLTEPKKKKPKQKKGGAGGGKRRNKPRFKLVRGENEDPLLTFMAHDDWTKHKGKEDKNIVR